MSGVRLSPRQQDCLRLVWERQATSKEIGAVLGISSKTVDGHIEAAVEALGARNRREAAAIAFGGQPRSVSGGGDAPGGDAAPAAASPAPSTNASRPWRSKGRRNAMTLAQTLGWIVAIAVGSLCVLALAVSVGNGLRPIARPILTAFDRLTH